MDRGREAAFSSNAEWRPLKELFLRFKFSELYKLQNEVLIDRTQRFSINFQRFCADSSNMCQTSMQAANELPLSAEAMNVPASLERSSSLYRYSIN